MIRTNDTDNPAYCDVPLPPSATAVECFKDGERHIIAVLSNGDCAVSVWACQRCDGTLIAEDGIKLWIEPEPKDAIPMAHGRQVAALLVAATALGEQWTQWSTRRRRRLVVTPLSVR